MLEPIPGIKQRMRSWALGHKRGKLLYMLANRAKTTALRALPDEQFARLRHWEATGRSLNLRHPATFNEKVWWLTIYNRDPLLTRCSDKLEVRGYVHECGLGDTLVPLIEVYSDPSEIDLSTLPDCAFIKTTHGSGMNRIWRRDRPFDRAEFEKSFRHALRMNYYHQSREWNYKDIRPRIVAEQVLEPPHGQGLVDFRFLCFDGEFRLLFVDIETADEDGTHAAGARRNVYDRNFRLLDIQVTRDQFDPALVHRPANFDEMIRIAETLARPFVFCRVDLYSVSGAAFLGEMTFYPGGGNQIVKPLHYEQLLGSWIDLESPKIRIGSPQTAVHKWLGGK